MGLSRVIYSHRTTTPTEGQHHLSAGTQTEIGLHALNETGGTEKGIGLLTQCGTVLLTQCGTGRLPQCTPGVHSAC